jgi:hypothetical protein
VNYDPNYTNCGRNAKQTVEMVFQQWDYTLTKTSVVGGNCTGIDVIRSAVNILDDELGANDGQITLTNPAGDTLQVELWEHPLEEMLVSARITDIQPEPEE